MSAAPGSWGSPGFGLPPAADLVGPFPQRPFLEAWWRHRGAGEALIVGSPAGLVAAWRRPDGTVELAGEGDLTDYHAPLGPGAGEAVASLVTGLAPGTRFRFDSLPEEAAVAVAAGVARAGAEASLVEHAATVILDLPGSREEYLASLDGKERHELRRKRRRFEAAFGPGRLVPAGSDGLAAFAAMHRAAPGAKGLFLTGEMEDFFRALLEIPGARLDLLAAADGVPLGAAFGFEDERAYYLYNSAYDPGAAAASPGVVLVDLLVQQAVESGRDRFDFLKGEEAYKLRLGGRRRPLFVVEGVR
ncbi:MAG: GNAT family N-acetyltransferase [Acidimicrobiia bacterium]|nr:GNAT family N-acetyltransferase [Acidimicrobiia bacterium]